MVKNTGSCALCEHPLSSYPIIDESWHFCCAGCQAVFRILLAKGEILNCRESPLFAQAVRSGLISNPALLEHIQARSINRAEEEVVRFYFEIDGMWCPSCAEVIRLILMQEKGLKSCHIDYATDMASVEFFPRYVNKEKIFTQIKSLGYSPRTLGEPEQKAFSKALNLRFIIAAFCAFNSMMFAYPLYATYLDVEVSQYNHLFAWLSFFISLPVLFYTGWPVFSRSLSSLMVGVVGMEALVTLGVFSAFFLSLYELFSGGTLVYFDSMSVIIAFVLLGKMIEGKAKISAKEALFRLNLSLPKRGRKRQPDGSYTYVPVKDVAIGDEIEVRMGEMIVLDGIVTAGEGICNESLMTGESIPTAKKIDAEVIAGTVLQHGCLIVKVTASAPHSKLQSIVDVIEGQLKGKQAYVRPVDKIVAWFVPTILVIVGMTAFGVFILGRQDGGHTVYETAFLRAISILLISCPCAIGIAAPMAESALIQALAQLGVILKNRACLQFLGRETDIIFDKTGTITQGHFKVLFGLDQLLEEEKQVLKGMVKTSNHPIAQAIGDALPESSIKLDAIHEWIGKGISAAYKEETYLLGSKSFLLEAQASLADLPVLEQAIKTVVYFGIKEKKAKVLVLGDELKGEALVVIKNLNATKHLISGDGHDCVKMVSHLCQFDFWLGQASPLEKQEYAAKLKNTGHIVAMIGDGINDAPALAAAHVGISVATASDISVQVSDILLTKDNLSLIPQIRQLARKGRSIVNQNLFWAFFYNAIGIVLAMMGWLTPIFAAFAMTISSLIVLLNTYRLR